MTIRRQYQLPNCSLILDGLNIDPTPGNEEVMSLLVNAECRISGLERSLNGSYNFFSALVRAVSQYSQEVLSGFAHPQVVEGEPLLVHINPGEGPYHHLVVQPEIADLGESGDGRAIDIKLSDVQLYDLSEAVDQFFDDTQTLPELSASLSPLPRRFVRTDEPLSDRALPAILGFGSLVAATMALSLLPLPQMREPAVEGRSTNSSADVKTADATDPKPPTGEAAGDGSKAPIDGIAAANTDSALWDKAPKITDESTLASLQSDLKAQIDEAIDPKVSFSDPLAYQVAVNEAGEVVGYQFENDAALRDIDKTPLPRLARASAAAENLEDNAIAQYAVAFNADGVAVTPSDGNTAVAALPDKPAAEPKEAKPKEAAEAEGEKVETEPKEKDAESDAESDAETTVAAANSTSATFTDEPPTTLNSLADVESLNDQLKNTIVENRNQPRVGEAAAIYRVRVKEDGTVIGYQPISQEATDAVGDTPLPDLLKSAPEETPAVDYRVAFTERGVVEVSPWWGWSFYE
jgi:Domain of unknown function (DUF4335)